jgi:carbon storage regulator
MLVLTRKVGERILIGKDVVIEVTKVRGNHVGIGIQCPLDVEVIREELIDEKTEGEQP